MATTDGRATSKKWRQRLFALLGVAAFVATVLQADLGGALRLLTELGPVAALALLPQGVWTVVYAVGWRDVLWTLGHRVPMRGLAALFFAAEAVMLSLPGGVMLSESLSVILLDRKLGVPLVDGLSAAATKKVLIMVSNALWVLLALALGGSRIAEASSRWLGSPLLLWAMIAAAVALLVVSAMLALSLASGSVAQRMSRALRRLPSAAVRRWLDERERGHATADDRLAAPFREPRRLMVATLWFLAQWALETLETYLLLRLLGAPVTFVDALAIETMGSLVRSFALMLPAGIGVQDASYVALLDAFGVPGASALGVAFVLLKRAKELAWVGVGYALLGTLRGRPAAAAAPDNSIDLAERGSLPIA
ncbi:MAG: flippase-like domain-containing protein [Myxococcales bacterium]|nr:flippase-like domain-containing protein [Myxococcales bacterium]